MNERIKELAEQAGFDVKRLMEPYPGGFPREDILALESFAELIVRECQSRVEQYINDCGEIGSLPNTVIKKHFGVE